VGAGPVGIQIKKEIQMNTKKRHQEILNAAERVLQDFGGIEVIDGMPQEERKLTLRLMVVNVGGAANCHLDTARRNVVKALRRARHPLNDLGRWGGARENTGPTPLPEDQKRQKCSLVLAPGSKELAQAIAEVLGLPGAGHVVDQALVRMVEGDQWLKIKLAEMGIILKAQK
jgi:hypothetical protein